MTDIIQIETQRAMENFRNNRHVCVLSLMYTVIQMSFCQEIYQGGFQLSVVNTTSHENQLPDYFRHSIENRSKYDSHIPLAHRNNRYR